MPDITELSYIYHSAPAASLLKIRDEGVHPSGSSSRDRFEKDLRKIATDENLTLPVARQDCSFFHPTIKQAVEMSLFDLTGNEDSPEFQIAERQGIAVIDLDHIERVPYVGDFQLFSDIIDLAFMEQPDEAVVSESYEDALRTYIETLRPLNTFDVLEQINEQYHLPEFLIEGSIPHSAVTEIIFRKSIQQKQDT